MFEYDLVGAYGDVHCPHCYRFYRKASEIVIDQEEYLEEDKDIELNCSECGKDFTAVYKPDYHLKIYR